MGNANTRMLIQHARRSLHIRNHLRKVPLAIFVLMLGKMLTPRLLAWIWQFHYWFTAEKPRLLYRATPENEQLLSRCVTMTQGKYYPLWYLFNGHLQTIQVARANDTQKHPIIAYERQLLDLPDGGVVSMDWAFPARSDGTIPSITELDANRRTVLILPGLTGGSSEHYIRCTVHNFLMLGWQVVVLNARGCAQTPLRTPQLFSIAHTEDLRFVVNFLTTKYNFASEAFIGLGFSMGSNVLVKYLGEERERSPFTAGISVGNPFDLVVCSSNMSTKLFNRLTYYKVLTNNLLELFFSKSNAHEVFLGHPEVDLIALKKAQSVYEFDDLLTRLVFKYKTVHDYYTDASSVTKLANVAVPLLCINAEDDPISVATTLPVVEAQVRQNDHVILCVTKAGGHLGFYEGAIDNVSKADAQQVQTNTEMRVWSVKVIAEFAESVRLRKVKTEPNE